MQPSSSLSSGIPFLLNTMSWHISGADTLGQDSEQVKKEWFINCEKRGEKSGVCPELSRRILVRLSDGSPCIITELKEQLRMLRVRCGFHSGGGVYCCIYTALWRVQALTRSNKLQSVNILLVELSCVYLLCWPLVKRAVCSLLNWLFKRTYQLSFFLLLNYKLC